MGRIKNKYELLVGIYHDERFFLNNIKLSLDISTNTDNPVDHYIGFQRIDFFLYDMVQDSIFISESESSKIAAYEMADINSIILPSAGALYPVIQASIIAKLNTILEDNLLVTMSEMKTLDGGDISYIWDFVDEEMTEIITAGDTSKWWNNVEISNNPEFSWNSLKLTWENSSINEESAIDQNADDFANVINFGNTDNEDG